MVKTPSASGRPSAGRPEAVGASRRLWTLFGLLALLQVMDLATTYIALTKGAREGNPALSSLLFTPAAPLLKVIALAGLAILIVLSTNWGRPAPARVLTAARLIVLVYVGIVANNIIIVCRLPR
jgi:Domain of unknown function (DUF5658)